MLCIAACGAVHAQVISDPAQLSNTKVYTINTARGYLTLDLDNVKLTSTTRNDTDSGSETYNQYVIENENADQSEEARQFGILNIDGKYYIYSPKLKQFALLHDATLEFYSTAGTGLAFTMDGQGDGPLRLKIWGWGNDGSQSYYINNNGNIVLNKYTAVDPGNSLMIEEVPGATLDFDEAMEVFNSNIWIDPHHVYYIATTDSRMGQWGVESDGVTLTGTREGGDFSNPSCADNDRKWAFYRDGSKTYLFNVGMQMFLSKNTKTQDRGGNKNTGQLTTSKDEFASVKFIRSNDNNYPFLLYIEDNGLWFNGQGNGSMTVSNWRSSFDDGNRQSITEVPGEDAYSDMQAFFEIPSWDITFHLMFEGQEIGTVVRNMTEGFDAKLPEDMIYNSCEYDYNPAVITSDDDVTVDVFWKGPFEFSSSYSSAKWYNLLFDRENDQDEARVGRYYAWYEEGREPYYPKQDADEALRSAPQSQWAFVGNPYAVKIYNKFAGEGMTLWNSGFDNGGNAVGSVVLRDGDHFWTVKNYEEDTYEFSLGLEVNGGYQYINQHGGASANSYFGLWGSYDAGSRLMVEDVPDIDVTEVWYDVYYNDAVVASAKVIGQEVGTPIADLPSELNLDFVELTYDESQDVSADLHVRVDAIWDGPFDLAADYSSAHWYDMSVHKDWYVTSDVINELGALEPVNANAIGLIQDSYQWAFVGDPYHIQIYNKAIGSSQVFAWTEAVDGNIPTFTDASTDHYWQIRQSTVTSDDYYGSFLITIPGLQNGRFGAVNQYGGPGNVLKVWYNANLADEGSIYTVFDVPDDFSQFVIDEIAPMMESETKWFSWNEASRAAIAYDPSYKESCSFETYKRMKETIVSLEDDINSYLMPPTGYYRLKNKYHQDFLGLTDDLARGNIDDSDATTVIKLTKVGENQYTIQVQDQYLQPVSRSTMMETHPDNAEVFTFFVTQAGYAVLTATPEGETDEEKAAYDYSFLHRRNDAVGNNDYVGWAKNAEASLWQLFDAKSINITTDANGLGSLYVPFAVNPPAGVIAFTGQIADDHIELTGIKGVIPPHTPVIIKAATGSYDLTISENSGAPIEGNDLKGVLFRDKPSYAMTLEGEDFVTFTGEALEPNTAYLTLDDTSINSIPVHFGDITGINIVEGAQQDRQIFDLSGRRLASPTSKGVYIIDNKKVVLK